MGVCECMGVVWECGSVGTKSKNKNMPKVSKSKSKSKSKVTEDTKSEHKEYIYKGTKRYVWCYLCEKYISSNSFKRHVQRKHVRKMYNCKNCPKKFACQVDLNSHQTSHSSVKRFKCLHCGLMFKWQSHRSKHIKNKHPEVERPEAFVQLKWNSEDFVHAQPSLRETSSIIYTTDTHRTPSGVVRSKRTMLL